MSKYHFQILVASSLLYLSACGGGGGGDSSSPQTPAPPPPPDAKPGGIWQGETTNDQQPGVVQELIGITTDDGQFRFLSLDMLGQFVGTISVDRDDASGTGLGWAPLGTTWVDGSVVTPIELSAVVTERQAISGEWSASTGESGTLTFSYDDLHARSSSFDKLSANWFFTDGSNSVTVTVDATGAISGSDTDGCVYSGAASIPDTAFNTYELAFEVTSCGNFDGDYSGLAVMSDTSVENDTLIVTADDGTTAIVVAFSR